jgi:hypothetical protein
MFDEKRHSLKHFSIPSNKEQKVGLLNSLSITQRFAVCAIGVPCVIIGLPLSLDIFTHMVLAVFSTLL